MVAMQASQSNGLTGVCQPGPAGAPARALGAWYPRWYLNLISVRLARDLCESHVVNGRKQVCNLCVED